MSKKYFFVFLCLWVCFFTPQGEAQQISIKTTLDTNKILIGAQTQLHVSVTADSKTKLVWPSLKDSLQKIELVNVGKIDTANSNDQKFVTFTQKIVITCFDTGFKAIPPLTFGYRENEDTTLKYIDSDALLLHVQGIVVDTTQAIKDIKAPVEIPFSFIDFLKEYWYYFLIGILVIAGIVWWFKFRKKKPITEKIIPTAPARPAHEIALEQLKILENKKLWQAGAYKQYHSELADIVRTYIESRYSVMAMELTTDETLHSLKTLDVQQKEKLSQLLTLADVVKFAKGVPISHENELSFKNALDFIQHTSAITKPQD